MILLSNRHRREANVLRGQIEALRAELARARIDPVTQLPTRDHWTRLTAAQARHTTAALLLDLDGFKAVNDEHGHAAGDLVLGWVGHRLRSYAGDHSVIGRLGGDEFALATTRLMTVDDLEILHANITAPIPVGGRELAIGASIGYAQAGYPLGSRLRYLLGGADLAMYAAKRSGGGVCTHDIDRHGFPLITDHPAHRTRYRGAA